MNKAQRLQELYDAKLAHYNKWLARKFEVGGDEVAKPYPGFPKQKELDAIMNEAPRSKFAVDEEVKFVAPKLSKEAKVEKAPKERRKNVKAALSRNDAYALIQKMFAEGVQRKVIIETLVSQYGFKQGTATTYSYTAMK